MTEIEAAAGRARNSGKAVARREGQCAGTLVSETAVPSQRAAQGRTETRVEIDAGQIEGAFARVGESVDGVAGGAARSRSHRSADVADRGTEIADNNNARSAVSAAKRARRHTPTSATAPGIRDRVAASRRGRAISAACGTDAGGCIARSGTSATRIRDTCSSNTRSKTCATIHISCSRTGPTAATATKNEVVILAVKSRVSLTRRAGTATSTTVCSRHARDECTAAARASAVTSEPDIVAEVGGTPTIATAERRVGMKDGISTVARVCVGPSTVACAANTNGHRVVCLGNYHASGEDTSTSTAANTATTAATANHEIIHREVEGEIQSASGRVVVGDRVRSARPADRHVGLGKQGRRRSERG